MAPLRCMHLVHLFDILLFLALLRLFPSAQPCSFCGFARHRPSFCPASLLRLRGFERQGSSSDRRVTGFKRQMPSSDQCVTGFRRQGTSRDRCATDSTRQVLSRNCRVTGGFTRHGSSLQLQVVLPLGAIFLFASLPPFPGFVLLDLPTVFVVRAANRLSMSLILTPFRHYRPCLHYTYLPWYLTLWLGLVCCCGCTFAWFALGFGDSADSCLSSHLFGDSFIFATVLARRFYVACRR